MKKRFRSVLVLLLCVGFVLASAGCNNSESVTTESFYDEYTSGTNSGNKDNTNQQNSGDNVSGTQSAGGNANSQASGGAGTAKPADKDFDKNLKGLSITIAYPGAAREPGVRPLDDEWSMLLKKVAKKLNVTISEKYSADLTAAGGTFLTNSLAGKDIADIYHVSSGTLASGVVKNAWLNLDSAFAAAGIDKNAKHWSQTVFKTSSLNGGTYGFYHGITDFTAVYYNVDMVTKTKKLEDPLSLWQKGQWTFDKFFEYCAKLQVKDAKGNITVDGCQLPAPASFADFIGANGGSIGKVTGGKWQQNLYDPKVLNALNILYTQVNTNKVLTCASGAWGTAFTNLYDGKTAMVVGPEYAASNSYMKMKDAGGLGIVPMPVGPDGTKADALALPNPGKYVIPVSREKNAAKYLYVMDQVFNEWYNNYKTLAKKQFGAIFYQDKYYDMYIDFVMNNHNGQIDPGSAFCMVSDSTGYSPTILCQKVSSGTSPATLINQFKTPMQNAQDDAAKGLTFSAFN